MLKIICGLGNPGAKYHNTPHNAGFKVLDILAERLGVGWGNKFQAKVASASVQGQKVLLVKPGTFMNVSGGPLNQVAKYFKVDASEIIVVHDDIDLEFGVIRAKRGGGNAGHNGLKSIESALSSKEFLRVRVGVGRNGDAADYVLRSFSGKLLTEFDDYCDTAASVAEDLLNLPLEEVQQKWHTRS
ncbi:MAG: aminoacyl-tRNA hydrolase [Candidatus Ancillula sp.]|nr:aminoacyl-tRNA hydrolase [Candidatus Ancillula sp.]